MTDNYINRWVLVASAILTASCLMAACAFGDDRNRHDTRFDKSDNTNYTLQRQLNYQVEGLPTYRMIIGRRQFDYYPNGLVFEKGNVVGVHK